MNKHINPGTDTTVNPVIINDTHRQKQQPPHPQRCDGDCLSCDVDTYISCDKRINPQPEKKSPFDKIIKWKHDFIKQHGYYPNVNDIWLEVDKIRESDKRCASHTTASSQQRIEQVIKELENAVKECETVRKATVDPEGKAFWRGCIAQAEEAIALLQAGE